MAVALLGVIGGASAWAFQESTVAPADKPASGPAAPAQPNLQMPDGKSGVQLSLPDAGTTKDGKGTEVRIPGLGKLGVLPKLDFGLDILYGANEERRQGPGGGPSDDVTLRGSIRHKF